MNLKQGILLPFFICLAFCFRMFVLSFGPVNAPLFSTQLKARTKRKTELCLHDRSDLQLEETSTHLLVSFKVPKIKGTLSKKFLGLLRIFAKILSFVNISPVIKDCGYPNLTIASILSPKDHLSFSVIRI